MIELKREISNITIIMADCDTFLLVIDKQVDGKSARI